jgi:hypothetical protein
MTPSVKENSSTYQICAPPQIRIRSRQASQHQSYWPTKSVQCILVPIKNPLQSIRLKVLTVTKSNSPLNRITCFPIFAVYPIRQQVRQCGSKFSSTVSPHQVQGQVQGTENAPRERSPSGTISPSVKVKLLTSATSCIS